MPAECHRAVPGLSELGLEESERPHMTKGFNKALPPPAISAKRL